MEAVVGVQRNVLRQGFWWHDEVSLAHVFSFVTLTCCGGLCLSSPIRPDLLLNRSRVSWKSQQPLEVASPR